MTLSAEKVSVERGQSLIVNEASVAVECGQMIALVGPNGAGKSTLLRTLAGELSAKRGRVSLDDRRLSDFSPIKLARHRAVMAQSTTVVFDFTVEEILGLGWLQSAQRTAAERESALREVAAQCQVSHLLDRTFNTLSGGEKQRVQFARCLLQVWQPTEQLEKRYLLLDEPTSSLDLAHELLVLELACRHAKRGAGVLVVLHDLNLAARFCDRIVLMFDGRVVDDGEPQDILGEEILSDIYATPIRVEWHDGLERLVVHT